MSLFNAEAFLRLPFSQQAPSGQVFPSLIKTKSQVFFGKRLGISQQSEKNPEFLVLTFSLLPKGECTDPQECRPALHTPFQWREGIDAFLKSLKYRWTVRPHHTCFGIGHTVFLE